MPPTRTHPHTGHSGQCSATDAGARGRASGGCSELTAGPQQWQSLPVKAQAVLWRGTALDHAAH